MINPAVSDSEDSDSDDEPDNIENRNLQNNRVVSGAGSNRLQSQVQHIKSQRSQAVGEEKLRELEEKWWLQGDIEAVKRNI